jgi:hypothetical protein
VEAGGAEVATTCGGGFVFDDPDSEAHAGAPRAARMAAASKNPNLGHDLKEICALMTVRLRHSTAMVVI